MIVGEIASPKTCIQIIVPAVAKGCFSTGTDNRVTELMGDMQENKKNSAIPKSRKKPRLDFT
jgi:hypothetical protein